MSLNLLETKFVQDGMKTFLSPGTTYLFKNFQIVAKVFRKSLNKFVFCDVVTEEIKIMKFQTGYL